MFQFENFSVYTKTEEIIVKLQSCVNSRSINKNIRDQLYRSSTSILLNIAEGTGKYTERDKKKFYIIARGSTYETVAILRILKLENKISPEFYNKLYDELVQVSKMLSGLIRSMNKR